MVQEDFFFGKIDSKNPTISLSKAVLKGEQVSPEFFAMQINRLLDKSNNRITLTCGTSYPDFSGLLKNLPQKEVGLIEIYAKHDVNEMMEATLACDIYMLNGVVSVVTNWCAYKHARAAEIVSTLLVPLISTNNSFSKSFVRTGSDKVKLPECNDKLLNMIFSLAGYPSAMKDYSAACEYGNILDSAWGR